MEKKRIGQHGLPIGRLKRGLYNAITDVDGVLVGHKTIIKGEGQPGAVAGIARTGVSVIFPHKEVWSKPVYAGTSVLNGNGEMTGSAWIEESGLLTTPIGLTNTHSVGVVRDAFIEYYKNRNPSSKWMLPVVAETWDGYLSDVNGMHVLKEDAFEALETARGGVCPQGNEGGGTGMTCFEFKGGIGSSSRIVEIDGRDYTIGVLVQANFGARYQFMLNGVPLGKMIPTGEVPGRENTNPAGSEGLKGPAGPFNPKNDTGSIIVVIATDVPLLPHQCRRLARRAGLGLGMLGSVSANSSGDIFIAFSTGNCCDGFLSEEGDSFHEVTTVGPETMSLLFEGVVEAVQESVFNALCAAETMRGIDGRRIYAIPMERVREIMSAGFFGNEHL